MTASLVRFLKDFDLAEELVQESLLEALEHWPVTGIPGKPGAWLLAVSRNRLWNGCAAARPTTESCPCWWPPSWLISRESAMIGCS